MTERSVYEGSGDASILTFNDFLTPINPDDISDYQPFNFVTRGNFTSYIIRSFAESRGKLSIQSIFCQLTENHSGFQVKKSMLDLLQNTSDITELLSEYEKQSVFRAYDGFVGVPTHSVKIAQHLFPKYRVIHQKKDYSEFGFGLTEQLTTLCSYMNRNTYAFQFDPNMSFREFQDKVNSMTRIQK